ncbi:hypothetical protein GGI11_000875, partial [Coemansia sp. RSA 2049]
WSRPSAHVLADVLWLPLVVGAFERPFDGCVPHACSDNPAYQRMVPNVGLIERHEGPCGTDGGSDDL